jgi:methionyl-tRNA formyltransferase
MGNLNEACEQISETSIKLSNELRNIRVDIFEKEKKVTQLHLKKVKEIYRKVRAFTDVKIGKEILEKLPVKIKTAEKPCGCRGK